MRCGVVVVALACAIACGCGDNEPAAGEGPHADAAIDGASAPVDAAGRASGDAAMPLAAPTGVSASDGASIDVVDVTWNAVDGATSYRVYRDGAAIGDAGAAMTSFLDTSAAAGGVTAPVLTAGQGTATTGVPLSWTAAACAPGATGSYMVTALRGGVESAPSDADPGFRAAYSVVRYQLSIDGGATFPFDGGGGTTLLDDGAPLGTITVGAVTATAGTLDDRVSVALGSAAIADGAVVHYAVRALTTGPLSPPSNVADGWRTTGAPSFQWNRHVFRPRFGEVISAIDFATTPAYDDTHVAADTLYAYDCTITAPGATTLTTTPAPGWRVATAGETPRQTWVTDGEVAAVAAGSAAIYVGGSFHYVGPPTGALVALDGQTGATAASPPQVVPSIDGVPTGVAATIPDGAGGWYVGGGFVAIGGVPQPRLAHVAASGALDRAFAPLVLDGDVTSMVQSGSTLFVAGTFSRVAWQPRAGFAALDATTGALLAYAPAATSADRNVPGTVSSLVVIGTTLYIGGHFATFDGVPRVGFAAIDVATLAVTPWDPQADCGGTIGAAIGLELYVSGCFTRIGNLERTGLAALDATSGTVLEWFPDPDDSTITAMTTDGSSVYVAGNFHHVGGQPRLGIASLDPRTGAARAFETPPLDPFGTVSALAITGHTVYLGGDFASLGATLRGNLAAVNAQTGALLPWAPVAAAPVASLAIAGSDVVAGGAFESVGGLAASNLAVLDPATGVLAPLGSGTDGIVDALALAPDGTSVFAGGQFTQAGGAARADLAELDATGAATAWSADTDGVVDELLVSGGTLYAAGQFHTVAGQPRAALAALDATSGAVAPFAPDPNAAVGHLALAGGELVADGQFTSIGGQPRRTLAAVDPTTGVATSWRPDPDGVIDDVVVDGDVMYVVGPGLERIDGLNRSTIASFTLPDFGLTSLFTNSAFGGPGPFAVLGGVVYGSGLMFNGGFDCTGSFDASTDAILAWKPGMAEVADRVVASGASIVEVGAFHYAAGYPTAGVVMFDP